MGEQEKSGATSNTEFKLLSVASLLKRLHSNISLEELHTDASRKFDTLVELLNGTYEDDTILIRSGHTLDELKQASQLIFNMLISEQNDNPFFTLCVQHGATLAEIKRRRNMLLQIFHPDRNNVQMSSASKTRMINDAFNKLTSIYNEKTMPLNSNHTNIPPSYPYDNSGKRNCYRTILFIIFFVSAAVGIIIKLFLHNS